MTFSNKKEESVQPPQQTTFAVSQTTLKTFAIIGFITLITAGIMFAVYMARFVPFMFGTLESSSAYLSSVVSVKTKHDLTVVPQTIIHFNKNQNENTNNAISSVSTSTHKNAVTKKKPVNKNTRWHVGKKTTNQLHGVGVNNIATTTRYYGLPDLSTTITAVGYLTGTSTKTFVKSYIIPVHAQVAVKFRVINQGTNVTGPWNLEIHIPTEVNSTYPSKTIASLSPGQPEDFTVRFTNAITGINKRITIIADPKNKIKESREKNNSASVGIIVRVK